MAKRTPTKRNMWPFKARETYHVSRAAPSRGRAPSAKAVAKQAKEREDERLERKMSDAQFETKLRKHYARGGNLREFLQANPGVSKAQFERCAAKVTPAGKAQRNAKGPHGWPQPREVDEAVSRRAQVMARTGRAFKRGDSDGAADKLITVLYGRNAGQLAEWQRVKIRNLLWNDFQDFRRNPSDEAAAVYEEFHGRPSEEVVRVKEKVHYYKEEDLAALGELRTLVVQARDGAKVTLSKFRKAILCTNEAKNQMFVRGGDQAVDLAAFGIKKPHEVETLGRVLELAYFTTKTHLGDEGGTAVYFHVTGETNENGKRKMAGWAPDLIYRVLDESLEFSGGSYSIRAEGVDK